MMTKEFIEMLNQEGGAAILEKIQAVGQNPEAVYAIAKEAGVTDSFDAFKAEITAQYEALDLELSDEDLAAIAGGGEGWKIAGAIVGGAAGGAGVAAAIIAAL